jgi:catechol 2,3-dioxygenase-like lactoylglutathione lyase family enzyme
MSIIKHHHITLCTGSAQEDYDFHTGVLGLKSVKKTALYDGDIPTYHLYYGNDVGEESTLVTTFPMRQSGRKARRGTGQTKTLALSVPVSSLSFWRERLKQHGFAPKDGERFGEKLLAFQHPCGIDYELVGIADDDRKPWGGGGVPAELAIRGTHGITVSVAHGESSDEFMQMAWNGTQVAKDKNAVRYHVGAGGSGAIVDYVVEPDLPPASWLYGEGVVHHTAFQVKDLEVQSQMKFKLEGIGLTDTSDRKDRGYFHSIYVRTPAGALFEATVSKPEGMTIDEPYESLGGSFQVPPVFAARKDEMLAYLEPLRFG